MEPFVEQLKRLCREHPTRAKWVFVPSHSVGHTIGDRLVLEGTDWANLRFVTPFDIALRMGAPFLVERNIDPSGEGLGPALIMRLLIGLSEGHGDGGYFRPLAHQPELARALWSTITQLRMAGMRASDLEAGAFTSAEKHAEFKALVEEYEAFLIKNNVGDRATVFAEAVNHLDWCPIQPQDCWTSLPDSIWSPLEHRILEMMPGERIAPEAFELPGTTKPRRLADAGVTRVAPDASAPLAFTQSPDRWTGGLSADLSAVALAEAEASAKAEPLAISFFSAGGSEAEIEEVFCRILASGQPLDQVEICAANGASTSLIWEKCLRYEWPVTMAEGVSAAMTRPGRALIAFADWIEDDLAAGRLRKLLQSGDIALPKGMTFGAGRAARILVKAQAAWGRDTYRLALARLAKSDRTRADRDDIGEDERERLTTNAAEADELSTWIEQIVGAIPKVSSGGPVGQRTRGQRTKATASGPGNSGKN